MSSQKARTQLMIRLEPELGPVSATSLVDDLERVATRPDQLEAVLVLLDELEEASAKAVRAAVEALPELQRRGGLGDVVPWIDLGIAIAGSSGATALKYFKESPLVVSLIEPVTVRPSVLALASELAESEVNVALEFLRAAPELLHVLSPDQLKHWTGISLELAQADFVLGIEFIRQMGAIARVLPVEQLRAWAGFGTKLITQNSLGKTDYLGTLEFFRTSPAILGDIEGEGVRISVVGFGSLMADRSIEAAIACLTESPSLLRRLPSDEWRLRLLSYGTLIAERDAEAALAYFRRSPDILALIGQSAETLGKFDEWFKAGIEILSYSAEGAKAYFAVETHKALASVEQALSGVPLRQIARSVKLFAQGLCGTDVAILSLPDSLEAGAQPVRAMVSSDGRSIALPSILRRYPTYEENLRLYMVMAAHEAGHLEFGTYRLPVAQLSDVVETLRASYGQLPGKAVESLADVFALYPKPGLILDLWMILEDARVEYLLRHEYPGLSRDLTALAQQAVKVRTVTHGLTVKEMVVDTLLLLSTMERSAFDIPEAITDAVEQLWAMCQTVLNPAATAEDAVRLAHRVYLVMDESLAVRPDRRAEKSSQSDQPEQAMGPRASDDQMSEYRPVTNWEYRGAMNPDMVRERAEQPERQDAAQNAGALYQGEGLGGPSGPGASQGGTARSSQASSDWTAPGRMMPSLVEEVLAIEGERPVAPRASGDDRLVFRYPEWDGTIQDYRANWCRVVEQPASEGSPDVVESILVSQCSAVKLLRRYFESLRPPGLRRAPGQVDGDELDLDAAVRRQVDLAAGAQPSERIYVKREKREREVAAAFLIDMSGSTSRQIESGRRVIDVEREGLVLLCEALEAVGDQYAVYGYSGQGRQNVDFLVMKDFDDRIGCRTANRLGGIMPRQQNRDGAAIRHATRKLLDRQAKTRLLVLISDGKPLDESYKDEYSLEDTKMALREARMKGVDAFCITIDRDADAYLRRMYGDVRYVVIDRVEALPMRMPRLYHHLTA
jgi:hypothetical protein